jgi:hypothetical protein
VSANEGENGCVHASNKIPPLLLPSRGVIQQPATGLAGCVTAQEHAAAADAQRQQFGAPGSDAYTNCRVNLERTRIMSGNLTISERMLAASARGRAALGPPPQPTTCTWMQTGPMGTAQCQ